MTEARDTGRNGLLLWFAFLGAPLAWAVHLGVGYAIEDFACAAAASGLAAPTGGTLRLILVAFTVAVIAVIVTAGVVSWRLWRRLGEDGEDREDRRAFMTVGGLLLSALFLFVVVLQGIPPLALPSCVF